MDGKWLTNTGPPKKQNAERILRWRKTGRDAYGKFTGMRNEKPIESRLLFYNGPNHTDFDDKDKRETS